MKMLLVGIVLGALLLGIPLLKALPKLMLKERKSPHGHDKTVQLIEEAVAAGGWNVSAAMDLQKSLAKHDRQVARVTVLKICAPGHAEKILKDDDAMFVSVLMPCSIAVYDKTDGQTYVSTMNSGLMGRMFGGTVAEVMSGPVAKETQAFTAFLD